MNRSRRRLSLLPLPLALVLAACGSGEGGDIGDPPGPDAAGGEAWVPLITGDWTLAPGGEKTSDLHTTTLSRDVYVGAIRPIEPIGTHHTVLASGAGFGDVIYASGVGTNAFYFPEGVGLKLPAGTPLYLQLHIYNTTDNPLSGTSGVEIIEVAAEDVVHQADLFLPGPTEIELGPLQETTLSGDCTVQSSQTVFGLFPHMHKLGKHFKTTVTLGGAPTVLHDRAYDFDEQRFYDFEPIELQPGDKVTTECTWNNTSNNTVTWGESSDSEMCFSILYRYPAQGGGAFGFCDD